MSDKFDPYHKWLGIPAQEQPPNHYRLLAIALYEEDADVISHAADRQMAHLRTFQSGAHSADSQKLLNEVSSARKCLLSPNEKSAYDQQLKASLQAATTPPAPPGTSTSSKIGRSQSASSDSSASKVSSGTKSGISKSREKPKPREPASEFEIITDTPVAGSSSAIRKSSRTADAAGSSSIAASMKRAHSRADARKANIPVWMIATGGVIAFGLMVAIVAVVTSGKSSPEDSSPDTSTAQRDDKKSQPELPSLPELNTNSGSKPTNREGTSASEPSLTKKVDLLDKINHDRDKIEGNWNRQGKELLAPAANFARLEIPLALPREYLLTLVATWQSGKINLCLGLPIEDRQVLLKIDHGEANYVTGLEMIDGKLVNENPTFRQGSFLRAGVPNTIQCAVGRDEVRAYCNGVEIVHWRGKPQQLSLSDKWATRDRHHGFIGGWNSSFRVQRLDVGPLPGNFKPEFVPELPSLTNHPAPSTLSQESLAASFARGEEIDLLKGIDPNRDAVNGIWKIVDGVVLTPNIRYARLQIQQPVPLEYEFVVVAQRVSGSEALNLGVSVAGQRAIVLLDGQGGRTSGLEEIEHKRFMANGTTYAKPIFVDGAAHEIVCTVTEKSVRATCDGKQIFDWHGNPAQLTLNPMFHWPDPKCLSLGSFDTPFKISRVVLRPISSATKLVEDKLPGPLPKSEGPTSQPPPAGSRWKIPTESEIAANLKEIKSAHADLYAASQRPEGKLPLADALMEAARTRKELPAAQYVLLTESTALAADAAEAKLAREACRLLGEQFEVDGIMLEAGALSACVHGIKTNSQRHDLTMECLAALAEAAAQDHYAAATEFADAAFSASSRSDDLELKKLARAHRDHMRLVLSAWEKVEPAAQALIANPKDAAASLEVGRFRCFWQADWQRGLPLLAQGSDPTLRSLAAADLKDPDKPADQLRLGDDWWEYGEKQPMPARLIVQDRAAFWYDLGLTDEVKGTQRTRVEARLAKFSTLRDSAGPLFARAAHPTDAVVFGKHWYKFFTDRLSWDEAKIECEKLGGYLVCIESPEENLFVKNLAIGDDGNARRRIPYWLGASDAEQERVFRWVNGSQSFYADWKSGEPNNSGGAEHYVGVMPITFGNDPITPERLKWNDYAARERFPFVCEWDR